MLRTVVFPFKVCVVLHFTLLLSLVVAVELLAAMLAEVTSGHFSSPLTKSAKQQKMIFAVKKIKDRNYRPLKKCND